MGELWLINVWLLQSSTPVPQTGSSLCTDTCQTTSDSVTEGVTVKVEPAADAEMVEGPVPISFPKIKVEREVSYMPMRSLLHMSRLLYAQLSVVFLTSLYAWQ